MDRDIALQITQKITAINTALQTLVTNTSPSNANRSVDNMRTIPEDDAEELTEVEEPEPTTTRKK